MSKKPLYPASDYDVGDEVALRDGSIWAVKSRKSGKGHRKYWSCVQKGGKDPDYSKYFTVAGESKRPGDLDYDLQAGISKILGSRTISGGWVSAASAALSGGFDFSLEGG